MNFWRNKALMAEVKARKKLSRVESREKKKRRVGEIMARLDQEFPDPQCALDHRNPFELLAATILSAQCTDERVNMVTPALFKAFPTPQAMAGAKLEDLEALVRSTGFFRNKAKNLRGMAQGLVADHGGEVPQTMDELLALPGVARKTANVILGNAFGIDEGVVVDTHVQRISGLLNLTKGKNPVAIEKDLMQLVPREHWTTFSHWLILHGRKTCIARRPQCGTCRLADLCPSVKP